MSRFGINSFSVKRKLILGSCELSFSSSFLAEGQLGQHLNRPQIRVSAEHRQVNQQGCLEGGCA